MSKGSGGTRGTNSRTAHSSYGEFGNSTLGKIKEVPITINGKSHDMIDFAGRKIVLVKINGVDIPFYCSTGSGGKSTPAGEWYPFLGMNKNGWLNKGVTDTEIEDRYGSPEFQHVAKMLNQKYGDVRQKELSFKVDNYKSANFEPMRKAINGDIRVIPKWKEEYPKGWQYFEDNHGTKEHFYERLAWLKNRVKKK